jgi:SAM-dependent methyltransferase
MKRELIAELRCPYCGSRFQASSEARGDAERIHYGLLKCRCFEFPIVDGILLLSLAMGHGGPSESLHPYVPLQVAAIEFLGQQDVEGLLDWMRRHMPLVTELLEGGPEQTYITYCTRMGDIHAKHVDQYLREVGRHEVVGYPNANEPTSRLRRLRGVLQHELGRDLKPAAPTRSEELERLLDYYAARFYSPRVNALALRLSHLQWGRRVLSLCCGHGVFENLLPLVGADLDIICVDGQFANLLLTRRYNCRNGNYIVHDVQFPLPFADGFFDGVFSSTCLPEIPAQKTFAEQAIRVTAPAGWTFFDFIWSLSAGVRRVEPLRHYRFCQNFFERTESYIDFFQESAGDMGLVGIDVPRATADYRDGGGWMFERSEAEALMRSDDQEISVLVVDRQRFAGFAQDPELKLLDASHLTVSPVFAFKTRGGEELRFERRPQFATPDFSMASKQFKGFSERLTLNHSQLEDPRFLFKQFCDGNLVFLPRGFDRDTTPLATLAGRSVPDNGDREP